MGKKHGKTGNREMGGKEGKGGSVVGWIEKMGQILSITGRV